MNKYERYKKVNLPWLKEIPNHWCIDKTKRFSENKKEINKGNRERNMKHIRFLKKMIWYLN